MTYGKFTALIGLAFVFLIGCTSLSSSNGFSPSGSTVSNRVNYTGDGGKGISLAILAPKANGLTVDQNYLPALVQGEFVSNFSGYSAISVMDRENLDNVYTELLSGYYDDDDKAGFDLGHLTATDYLMNGSITRTVTGYSLQMQIVKITDKMTEASYSGTCTFAELDNLTGIRKASLDLLQKMGVTLTEQGRTELAEPATANRVNAQTALAQGITAQQGGTVVEALSYYYQASAFDSSLLEATNRANMMSAAISSGNIGVDVRNDIQRRKEWEKILNEAEDFFGKHLPFEIVYDPTLTQGKVDYSKETVDLSFNMNMNPTDDFRIVQSILDGLNKTGKKAEWGFEYWPMTSASFVDVEIGSRGVKRADFNRLIGFAGGNVDYGKAILVNAVLINDQGKTLATAEKVCFVSIDVRERQSIMARGGQKIRLNYTNNNRGGSGYYDGMEARKRPVIFTSVNANDVTDKMTVKIVSVDGIDTETIAKTGYIKISTGKIK
jgi:hypothetical protein